MLKNEDEDKLKIERAANILEQADCLIIAAGAGMGPKFTATL